MICSIPVLLIILHITFIDILVSMPECTFTMGCVVVPVSFVDGAIWPFLLTFTHSFKTMPLPCVLRTTRKLVFTALRQLGVVNFITVKAALNMFWNVHRDFLFLGSESLLKLLYLLDICHTFNSLCFFHYITEIKVLFRIFFLTVDFIDFFGRRF